MNGKFYENNIVIQYDKDLIEVWDEAKRLRNGLREVIMCFTTKKNINDCWNQYWNEKNSLKIYGMKMKNEKFSRDARFFGNRQPKFSKKNSLFYLFRYYDRKQIEYVLDF